MTAETVDTSVINARVSRSIRVLIAARGITAKQLADAVGMSEDTLGRRLKDGGWRFDEVLVIAGHLDVAVSYLYETDPENWFRPSPETESLHTVRIAPIAAQKSVSKRGKRQNTVYCSERSGKSALKPAA